MTSDPQRILTTHTGSFSRPARLRAALLARSKRQQFDKAEFEAARTEAISEVVARQIEIGIDIINDGDQSKTGFAQYVRERLTGFEGELVPRAMSLEGREFPGLVGSLIPVQTAQPCVSPLGWKDFGAVERDIIDLKAAMKGHPEKSVFMTSVSPGSFVNLNPNAYYKDNDEYMAQVIDVMRREYEAIAAAGFIVQIDSPDLAQRSYNQPDMPVDDWYRSVEMNVEAINEATRKIPQEQVRVHVCWGANEGPHNHDTELSEIIDFIVRLRASAISVVTANGRHEHEWRIWETTKLPEGTSLIPGVIDSTTNIIEHPEAVAERLVRYARVLGRDRVMAGVDCGFGTVVVDRPKVDPLVAWAKLGSLVEGARIASSKLWPH
jgi:5-methyltetrahydropteroyltriglutamate--homocysteine methyltransferase